jgi:hypothetical protein
MNPLAKVVWETLYPDRREWEKLEEDTRVEWSRMVDVVEGLVKGRENVVGDS